MSPCKCLIKLSEVEDLALYHSQLSPPQSHQLSIYSNIPKSVLKSLTLANASSVSCRDLCLGLLHLPIFTSQPVRWLLLPLLHWWSPTVPFFYTFRSLVNKIISASLTAIFIEVPPPPKTESWKDKCCSSSLPDPHQHEFTFTVNNKVAAYHKVYATQHQQHIRFLTRLQPANRLLSRLEYCNPLFADLPAYAITF